MPLNNFLNFLLVIKVLHVSHMDVEPFPTVRLGLEWVPVMSFRHNLISIDHGLLAILSMFPVSVAKLIEPN